MDTARKRGYTGGKSGSMEVVAACGAADAVHPRQLGEVEIE